ncbi:MAG: lysostaphin resistance A-like protein [Anaerolineales bacterium]
MTDVVAPAIAEHTPPPARWLDLVLYLVGGFGSFLALSIAVGFLAGENRTLALAGAGLANFICLAGTVYVFGIRRGRLSWAGLGLFPPRWRWLWLLLIAALTLALLPVRALVALLTLWLVEGNFDSLQARSDLLTPEFSLIGFTITFLFVGILAPISEELFFRGALYGWLAARYRVWIAVLVSSTLFGLAHFDSLGVVVSSFIMGVMIALVYEYTRSLWAAIAIHVLNNSLAVLLLYAVLALLKLFPQFQPASP